MTSTSNTEYPPAISVHEAARILQVTPATAYSWVRNGELPSVRLGGRIRIPTA
ncbi:MAG: helix-turn-helix domain-containing protein, partial [Acidobacteria bacterium]|nr:helix-turn-helix domain-containing protein [Acidobacteriota bacterium]